MVSAVSQSKLIANEFCRERELCPRYFSKRKKQLGFGVLQQQPATKLVKIHRAKPIAAMAEVIILQHGGTQMKVPCNQSPQWLADLVRALAQ